jgi:hypothetical protein
MIAPILVILLVLVGLVALVGLWLMATYNGLVSRRQTVKNAWARSTCNSSAATI